MVYVLATGPWLLLLLMAAVAGDHVVQGLYFEDGFDHHYTYSSDSDMLGMHNITTIIKLRIRSVNSTSEGDVGVHQLMMDSIVQHSQHGYGYIADNPMGWDLTRRFYFIVGSDGVVTMVHFHPDEEYEVLSLKKVLTSTLSTNVKGQPGNRWTFRSKELDHSGHLEHDYKGERTAEGCTIVRRYNSTDKVHRQHNKTLRLNVEGTPLHVESWDNVTLQSPKPTKPREPMEGEAEIPDITSGEFPIISSTSASRMELTLKRRHDEWTRHDITQMEQDTILVRQKKPYITPLDEVRNQIEELLDCVHLYADKFQRKRTTCVNDLRKVVATLHKEEFVDLGRQLLTQNCQHKATKCADERTLILDLLATDGSATTQRFITDYIFGNTSASEEDLQRCLFHCVTLAEPVQELVLEVERLCFNGSRNMPANLTAGLSKTQRRACLADGSLAKSLHDVNVTESDRLVVRLEDWLSHHNQTEAMNIIQPRKKRSILEHDVTAKKHIHTKMVLLLSLGNAGKQRSLGHIMSYLEPNVGVSPWRRAAINSLRHFTCNKEQRANLSLALSIDTKAVADDDDIMLYFDQIIGIFFWNSCTNTEKWRLDSFMFQPGKICSHKYKSATALVTSAVYDEDGVVRKVAREVLDKHPMKYTPSKEQQNIILSKRYTYPVAARVKRDLVDTLYKGIEVHIEPPGIDWDKKIGNSHIGANFGLHMRNSLDLKLGLLSGNVLIDVYDEAYANVHVGLLDINVPVANFHVCYKGHAEYTLNVLKDFGINSLRDLVNIYDNTIETIVTPIKQAVESFKNVLEMFQGQGLKSIIKTLSETVLNIPHLLEDAVKLVREFATEIVDIRGHPVLEEIVLIVLEMRNTLDAVERDLLLFFNDIVDSVTVQLPFVGKKILGGFNVIKNAFKTIMKQPRQSVFGMMRGVSQIQMALTLAVDVTNNVTRVCQFDKGRSPEWMTANNEIQKFFRRLNESFVKLGSFAPNLPAENAFNNGVQPVGQAVVNLESSLKKKWEKELAPMKKLMDMTKPFIDSYKAVMDVVKGLKSGYKMIKKVIELGKSTIQKVFGPKFHKKFPSVRREGDSGCRAGTWPTTTGDVYNTTGIDLLMGMGGVVSAPVDCIVHVQSDTKVVLQPTSEEFKEVEIVIENIVPSPEVDGTRLRAGAEVGQASMAPKCERNFIHLSVRQVPETEITDDADYEYVDPSPYLDRFLPVPKWIQGCNDYEFRYIRSTVDLAEMVSAAMEETKQHIERYVGEDVNNLKEDIEERINDLDVDFDEAAFFSAPTFEEKIDVDITESLKSFKNRFKTALYGKNGLFKMLSIFEILNLNKKEVHWILERLEGTPLHTSFINTLKDLDSAQMAVPVGNPSVMGLPYLRGVLASSGITEDLGDISDLTAALITTAETNCPMFKDKIAAGGHVCMAHSECMGVTCNIVMPVVGRKQFVQMEAVINSSGFAAVSIGSNVFELNTYETEHSIDVGVTLGGFGLTLVVETNVRSDSLSMSIEAKLCNSMSVCLNPVEVFTDVEFPLTEREMNNMPSTRTAEEKFHNVTLKRLIVVLGEYDLLNGEIMKTIKQVRWSVLKKLLVEEKEKMEELIQEFQDILDFCEGGHIPVVPLHIPFFGPLTYLFMVGPIPFVLEFGGGGVLGFSAGVDFCILSMSTNVTLTPWVSGNVWGALYVDIGFAYGGIKLTGYLLETTFPMSTEFVFAKFPLDIGSKMDMVLTPLRLVLSAFAKIRLLFITKTIFNANIWEYKTPSITKNIFNKIKRAEDKSPPELTDNVISARRKRTGDNKGCIVQQIPGRNPDDTAFSLEVHAEDAVSDVKLFYAIGTYRGGTNVVDWTHMGGSNLLAPANLPGGIPLFWTVKAENSQGLSTTTQCFLATFDSTIPDGRVEHSYTFSSHPNKLSASVIVFEDSLLDKSHYVSLGYSPGKFGSEFVGWESFQLGNSKDRDGITGILGRFAVPRAGKLIVVIMKSLGVRTVDLCAQACVDYGLNCVSFDYETHTETCDLHDVVLGPSAVLVISGTYSNYERLGVGYNTLVEYTDLPLTHGTVYFINVRVRNVLGYVAHLVGEGTLVDFTPPKPGLILNNESDVLRADQCNAAITQRCIDVTWNENHRIIIDGPGSGTVFNGLDALYDALYTLANHYLSANWNGFHDDESGIWGYTWAVGTHVCGVDILPYTDPHTHLSSMKFWTDSGFHKGIHLPDGAYYVTVQALNGAELGGSLVTTVCHSVPFLVDTSAPLFMGVTDIIYDEDFDLIAIYYDAEDDLSKIALVEFGLGKTKYDVQLKAYSQHESMDREDPFLSLEELGLREGIPAWIRVRVTNHVGLFTTGHGTEPILIDRSPPLAGDVLDGPVFQQDLTYQSNDRQICAQWRYFYDPESGIDRYSWSVGTTPGGDDVVPVKNLTHYEKSACADVNLQHNHTYYSIVYTYNNALNSKGNYSVSNGVLIDITPPLGGHVNDGIVGTPELGYTSETVSKHCHWDGYYEPESGINRYQVDVYVNTEHKTIFDVGRDTSLDDHTVSMEHMDNVYFIVHAINGAELEVSAESDGFLVDHTSPIMTYIADHVTESPYQSKNTSMRLRWNYYDSESGIKEYQTMIYESKYGLKQKFWPTTADYNVTLPSSPYFAEMSVVLDGLTLVDGVTYSLHVTAINQAMMSMSHESLGVTVDTTPPEKPCVHIGFPDEEHDDDRILHPDQNGIRVSWSGRDAQSGIARFLVAVGIQGSPTYLTDFTDYGKETTTYIQHVHFQLSAETNITYVVYVKAINGAGLESAVGESGAIYILKANVPGVVFDGWKLFEDEKFSNDHTSIAASFYGFASVSCNITGYHWGIGTEEYSTDLLSFTNYGIVMYNITHGFAQINTDLMQDTTYYVTIRAVTGCHGEYIVSSSDGITIDSAPPDIYFSAGKDTEVTMSGGVVYHTSSDVLAIMSNVSDTQPIINVQRALGSLPFEQDVHPFTTDIHTFTSNIQLVPGNSVFMTTYAVDAAGNDNTSSSPPFIVDTTTPVIHGFSCTPYISIRKSVVVCDWSTVEEFQSVVSNLTFAVGTQPLLGDIVSQYLVPYGSRQFRFDVISSLRMEPNITDLYVYVSVVNIIGQRNDYEARIGVDITPPSATSVTVVTRAGNIVSRTHQPCQTASTYMELSLDGLVDDESQIDPDRFEVCVGSKRFGSDLLRYTAVSKGTDGLFFVNGFQLASGSVFYATIRAYNKAGLSTDVTSERVVVSPSPYLSVFDGPGAIDIDFQSRPNVIQGHWEYSDTCPIKLVYWQIRDILDTVIVDFTEIADASTSFYDDELKMDNGVKYISVIKTIDATNRTRIARSDGLTVRIQPPTPGFVRDGLDDDITYQFSTTELSANWDDFGDTTDDPTQRIHHYELAVGNDRRYANTRTNVHYFVNVGLNTCYTFTHLNLTAKLVKYYITVRAVSMSSGFSEGYSNGIRVGFNGAIIHGTITANKFQSSTNTIAFTWNGFYSDIGIGHYKAAVSSHNNFVTNDTFDCNVIELNSSVFDVSPMINIGLDEYIKIRQLHLHQNKSYYPTVIAADDAGMCTAVTGTAITIDTTPPVTGDLFINGFTKSSIIFAESDSQLTVSWDGFNDLESGIHQVIVDLYQCPYCTNMTGSLSDCISIAKSVVQRDSTATFYELQLSTNNAYIIRIVVNNGASLNTIQYSAAILVDTSKPLAGTVKITDDWEVSSEFQSSTSTIHGLVALATTSAAYTCSQNRNYFPSDISQWETMNNGFSSEYKTMNQSGAYLGIGYNVDLSNIIRTGVTGKQLRLRTGTYSFNLKAAHGDNIITTVALLTDTKTIPFILNDKPMETVFDYGEFDNVAGLTGSGNSTHSNETNNVDVTQPPPKRSLPNNTVFDQTNSTLQDTDFGIGVHILGYKIQNNKAWHHLFWARSKSVTIQQWFRMDDDPTASNNIFSFQINQPRLGLDKYLDMSLLVNGNEVVTLTGFQFTSFFRFAMLTWNEDNYKPRIDNIYQPFYSEAIISSIHVPENRDSACQDGRGFYDGESKIKEVWAGVSDSEVGVGTISPLTPLYRFCYPCQMNCDAFCQERCEDDNLTNEYEILPLTITGLNLKTITMDNECLNISSGIKCNANYYLNVKVVNFARQTTVIHSNAIRVDSTPPACQYVECLDPEYSEDAPTSYLGSSTTVGAFWNCTEDVGQIHHYNVSITTADNTLIIMNSTDVGTKSKVRFTFDDGTFIGGHVYRFHTTAVNTAGMTTTSACSVRVLLKPPRVDGCSSIPIHVTGTGDDAAFKTDSQDTIGIRWTGGENDTKFYEWKVGTKPGSHDIFPPVMVGINSSGSAAIIDGKLHLNEDPAYTAVSEFRVTTNITGAEWEERQQAAESEKTFFFMEPGRCVYQTLHAIGYSHLRSKLETMTVCIKRTDDVQIDGQAGAKVISKRLNSNIWQAGAVEGADISMDAEVLDGEIQAGTLALDDKLKDYGSAASYDFVPYISDPQFTGSQTSRMLRNRIVKFCDVSFYVSPTPVFTFETVYINVTVPTGCQKDVETQPALIYWDFDKQEWTHNDEGCNTYLTAIMMDNVYSAKLCILTEHSYKRSTVQTMSSPRQMEVVQIYQDLSNHAPSITHTIIQTTEDSFTAVEVETYDEESDKLLYEVVNQPSHANCTITDVGILDCIFEKDYYGYDEIEIQVSEYDLPPYQEPLTSSKVITMHVEEAPDQTERLYVDPDGWIHSEVRPQLSHTLIVEANRTSSVFAGTIILMDMDGSEEFTLMTSITGIEQTSYTLTDVDITGIYSRGTLPDFYNTIKAYKIYIQFPSSTNGEINFRFIAQTRDMAYTPSVSIDVYLLLNPCVDGTCRHPTRLSGCDDIYRAQSFAEYECVCRPGYVGQWCEVDVNECEATPCAELYDCEDLENTYSCTIKLTVRIYSLLAAVGVGAVILAVILRKRHNAKCRQWIPTVTEVTELGQSDEGTCSTKNKPSMLTLHTIVEATKTTNLRCPMNETDVDAGDYEVDDNEPPPPVFNLPWHQPPHHKDLPTPVKTNRSFVRTMKHPSTTTVLASTKHSSAKDMTSANMASTEAVTAANMGSTDMAIPSVKIDVLLERPGTSLSMASVASERSETVSLAAVYLSEVTNNDINI